MPFLIQPWHILLAELSLARPRTDKTLPPILSPPSCELLVGGMATHVWGGEYSRPKVPKVVVKGYCRKLCLLRGWKRRRISRWIDQRPKITTH